MSRHGQDLASVAEAMALALISLALVAGVAPAADPVLRLRAFTVDPTGTTRARTQTLEIAIERWSTDAERQKILDTLVERSSENLLDVVQSIKPRVGYIRRDSGLGWDVRFARVSQVPGGGERLVFATDRPTTFVEAAKVRLEKESGQIEIENYGVEPVRLSRVTVEGKAPSE